MKRRRQARPTPPAAQPPAARPLTDRLALAALWLLILLPPLIFDPMAKDSFRLPKEVVSETLVLVSLALLCFRLRRTGALGGRRLRRHPAVLAALPVLAAATLAAVASAHPLHAREGWTPLAIGTAALAGWSLALTPEERRRLLREHRDVAALAERQLADQLDPVAADDRAVAGHEPDEEPEDEQDRRLVARDASEKALHRADLRERSPVGTRCAASERVPARGRAGSRSGPRRPKPTGKGSGSLTSPSARRRSPPPPQGRHAGPSPSRAA